MSDIIDLSDLSYKDIDNPKSLVSLTTGAFQRAISNLPDDIFELSERDIIAKGDIKDIERRLRISFFIELSSANRTGRIIALKAVVGGVCTKQYFDRNIITNPYKLAFLITPPVKYQVKMEELLELALEQERDILLAPHMCPALGAGGRPITDKDGKNIMVMDFKAAKVKVDIAQDIHNRVKGMPIHRTVNLNENVNRDVHGIGNTREIMTPENIDHYLAQLESKAGLNEVRDIREAQFVGDEDDI